MVEQIFLIRHGETEWSLTGQHTGRTDLPLTANGENRAAQLHERLQGIQFARVLTSPLQRARRTCELAGFGATARLEPDLQEWNYGDYEGRTTLKSAPASGMEMYSWTVVRKANRWSRSPGGRTACWPVSARRKGRSRCFRTDTCYGCWRCAGSDCRSTRASTFHWIRLRSAFSVTNITTGGTGDRIVERRHALIASFRLRCCHRLPAEEARAEGMGRRSSIRKAARRAGADRS